MLLPHLSEGLFLLSCDYLIADMNEVQVDIDIGIDLGLSQADLTRDRLAFEVMIFVHLGSSENKTVKKGNLLGVFRGCRIVVCGAVGSPIEAPGDPLRPVFIPVAPPYRTNLGNRQGSRLPTRLI
jgi:hypothetical protein